MRTLSKLPSSSSFVNREVALNELIVLLGGAGGLSTATLSQVADNAASVTLLAANSARRGCVIVNTSSAILYVAFAASATTSAFTYRVTPNGILELFGSMNYTGLITGIWASDPNTGSAVITSLEA